MKTRKFIKKVQWKKLTTITVAILLLIVGIRYLFLKPKDVLANSLFKLDEGYGTSSAVNDVNGSVSAGSITGAVWKTEDLCKDTKCLYFDGNQDYVSFSDDSDLDFGAGGSFTISAWFRHATKTSGTDILFGKINNSDNDGGYQVQMESDGDITCEIEDSDANTTIDDSVTSTAATYDDNQWHYVSCVKNANTSLTLYIDGVQVAQDSSIDATATLANDDSFYIGIDGDGTSNDYTGFIDEVSVEREAKSEVEIAATYLKLVPSTTGDGPVGYWKLDENTGTTAYDSSGNEITGTLVNNPSWTTGKFGSSLDFTSGSSHHLTTSGAPDHPTQALTISAWIKPDNLAGLTKQTIISDSNFGNNGYRMVIAPATDALQLNLGNGSETTITSATNTLTNGVWQHVVATFNKPNVEMFVNGVKVTTDITTFNSDITQSTDSLFIGKTTSTNWYFDGIIDEVKIYDYARSQTQILEDMVANPPTGVAASFGPDQSYLSSGLVGYWTMEEAGDANRNDYSGNGNTLTETTSDTVAQASGKFGYGGDFESGDTEYIYITDGSQNGLDMSNRLTACAWIKPETVAFSGILGKFSSPNLAYDIHLTAAGGITFYVSNDGTSYSQADSATGLITTGAWAHVCAVFDGGYLQTFVNGQESGAKVSFTSSLYNGSAEFIIGSSWGDNFDGVIDDVRIYNRSLNAKEISNLYNWAPGPIGHWKMDENTGTSTTNDSSGNGSNASLNGGMLETDWRPGKFGASLNFDGTNDYVNIYSANLASLFSGNQGTVTLWTKIDSATWSDSTDRRLFTIGYDANNYVALAKSASNTLNFLYTAGGTGEGSGACATGDTNWVFLAMTWDKAADSVKYYCHGIYFETDTTLGTYTSSGNIASNRATIGVHTTGGNFPFKGQIDDFRLYSYPRTAGQIIEDMNAGHPAPGSPVGSAVAHWKFDEGYGTTAYDSDKSTGGAEDLTLSSASWTNSGKFGKAWDGDGTKWISRTNDANLDFNATESFSISTWIKTDSATNPANGTEYILSTTAGNTDAGYSIYATTSGYICFGIDDDTSWGPDVASCTTYDFYDGNWHHIVAIRDVESDTTKIYIDTIEADSDTDTTTATLDGNNLFYVGDFDGDNNATSGIEEFAGDIDDLRIYRRALTEDQIKMLFNGGFSSSLGSLSTDSSGNPSWSANNEYCPPGQGSTCTAPVGHWKLDENTGTSTVYDSSGNERNGTLTNISSDDWTSGRFGSGLDLDNANDYVSIADNDAFSATTTNELTVETWFYPTDLSLTQEIVNKGSTSNYEWALRINGDGTFNGYTYRSTGADHMTVQYLTPLQTNTWYHLAMTINLSTPSLRIYLNGNLVGVDTTSSGSYTNGTAAVRIGERADGVRDVEGIVDDVRIYNYARTPAQIAWDMNQGKPVGWWKFDETSWTNNCSTDSVFDSSGNGAHGDACPNSTGPTTPVTGKFNNAGNFDGTNDYISLGTLSALNTSYVSVAAWVNLTNPTDGNSREIFNRQNSANAGTVGLRKRNSDNAYYFSVRLNGSESTLRDVSANTAATTGWHHVVGTYDGATVRMYVDGILQNDTETIAGTIDTDTLGTTEIGRNQSGINYMEGQIDDLRVYSYPLSLQQVRTIMNEGSVTSFTQ